MASAAPFVFASFRGGVNLYDPPTALDVDQVVEANNVELTGAACSQRRRGNAAVDLPASVLAEKGVWKMYRHLPSADETASELWLLAGTPSITAFLSYKVFAVWTDVALIDTAEIAALDLAAYQFTTLHQKLYIPYPSAQDRLHVWDGTTLRRTGLRQPDPPTAVESGSAAPTGGYDGVRYMRVRFIKKSGAVILLRSEPSESFILSPDGTHAVAEVTRPALISEGETHWEYEASTDNANFYRVSTQAIGTTTFTDALPFGVGYAVGLTATGNGVLSETIGAYTLPASCKFIIVDNDRPLFLGSFDDAALGSYVTWAPPLLAPGVGNDERLALETDPFLSLDGSVGGEITGGTSCNNVVYVFKIGRTYRLTRTGQVAAAYEAELLSPTVGAMPGSIFNGTDPSGNPAVFFMDREVGPCMIGTGGLTKIGRDIRPIWDTHNTTTSAVVNIRGVFYPKSRQVLWAFATSTDVASETAPIPIGSLVFTGFGDSDAMKFLSPSGADLGQPLSVPPGAGIDGIVTLKPSYAYGIIGGGAPDFGSTGIGTFNSNFTFRAEAVTGGVGKGAARDDSNHFYGGGGSGSNGQIIRYDVDAADRTVYGPILPTGAGTTTSVLGLGVNGAGTIAYYCVSCNDPAAPTRTVVYGWSLLLNNDLGPFAVNGSGWTTDNNAIIALSNGEVLVGWKKAATGGYVKHYSAAGTVLHTYTLAGTNAAPTALTHGATDATFFVSYFNDDALTASGVTLTEITVATGVVVGTPFNPEDGDFEFDSAFTLVRTPPDVLAAPTGDPGTTKVLVLHLDELRFGDEGGTRGWTTFTGSPYENVTDMTLYSSNVNDNVGANTNLVPFMSRCDMGNDGITADPVVASQVGSTDLGENYEAVIRSRPMLLGQGTQQFGIRAATLVATASADTTIDFSVVRDLGLESNTVEDVSLAPSGAETHVFRALDNSHMSGCRAFQVEVRDATDNTGLWELQQVVLIPTPEAKQ